MAPKSIIIVGSGVFGLSTALELTQRPSYSSTTITVIDAHPFPTPHASSIDTSRIIRADYKDPLYATLAAEAQVHWRGALGAASGYSECGLVLVGSDSEYVAQSMVNVTALFGAEKVVPLVDSEAIRGVCGTGGASGKSGYLNKASGWADAEEAMRWLKTQVEGCERVRFVVGEVVELLGEEVVLGVVLKDRKELRAELTILATGAWTPGLVDLKGRAIPTGQVLGYLKITPKEEERYKNIPILLNFTTGLFIIPPRAGILKVARHAAGYLSASGPIITSSIPAEAEAELLSAITEMVPEFSGRPLERTRLCWYTDTPTADFLVCWYPGRRGLFVATGGSGHGFKFLPVLGKEVVDVLEGGGRFRKKWRWREGVESVLARDGSRGGAEQVDLGVAMGVRMGVTAEGVVEGASDGV